MSIPTRYWDLLAAAALFAAVSLPSRAQDQSPAPASQAQPAANSASSPATPDTPAQIELLETKIRFEPNGDSRKEVHTRVRINSELGVRQFAHLNFNFNRSYEQIDIPLLHITHKSGGSADILPSAITDQPNPAVADFPAYQDVRVKSIRILGLEPADILEYRVITTTTHHPLAPDFWLDHSFDRTGIVTKEIFDLDLPASRFGSSLAPIFVQPTPDDPAGVTRLPRPQDSAFGHDLKSGMIFISEQTPPNSKETTAGENSRLHLTWDRSNSDQPESKLAPSNPEALTSDIVVTTYPSWDALSVAIGRQLFANTSSSWTSRNTEEILEKQKEFSATPNQRPEESIYEFVAKKIRTVDLPLGATGFRGRKVTEILSSAYATPEDKAVLFSVLSAVATPSFDLIPDHYAWPMLQLPRPSVFKQFLIQVGANSRAAYLNPALEVAPFGVVTADLRGSQAWLMYNPRTYGSNLGGTPGFAQTWRRLSNELPFRSLQRVNVDATITPDGTLNAKVKYSMRGDNELLLRIAFHQSPRDKWKEVAQLISLSDGFRGKIISASASDPLATKNAFTVEYEISQPKFVDWSKRPVRIPAPLPLLSVPDLPGKVGSTEKSGPIDLGTPLDVDTRLTLHVPPGTSVEIPTGTVVDRDYATFASRYNTQSGTVTATRHINFLRRHVDADRVPDYAAFLHAVQTDQAQLLTLTPPTTAPQPTTASQSSKP
jgi:Domain of Unknown Function with PDB structure (DUF3857)